MKKILVVVPNIGTESELFNRLKQSLNSKEYSYVEFPASFPNIPESFCTSLITGVQPLEHGISHFLKFNALTKKLGRNTQEDINAGPLWTKFPVDSNAWVINWPASLSPKIQSNSTYVVTPEFLNPLSTTYESWPVQPYSVHPVSLIEQYMNLRLHPSDIELNDLNELKSLGIIETSPEAMKLILVLLSTMTTIQSNAMFFINRLEASSGFMVLPIYSLLNKIIALVPEDKIQIVTDDLYKIADLFLSNLFNHNAEFIVVGDGFASNADSNVKPMAFALSKGVINKKIVHVEDIYSSLCKWFDVDNEPLKGKSNTIIDRNLHMQAPAFYRADSYFYLSESLRARDHFTLSYQAIQEAFKLAPENRFIKFRYVQSIIEEGNIDKAKSTLCLPISVKDKDIYVIFEFLLKVLTTEDVEQCDLPKINQNVELIPFIQMQLLSILTHLEKNSAHAFILAFLSDFFVDKTVRLLFLSRYYRSEIELNELETALKSSNQTTLVKNVQAQIMNKLLANNQLGHLSKFI